jgi:hypothetical protein
MAVSQHRKYMSHSITYPHTLPRHTMKNTTKDNKTQHFQEFSRGRAIYFQQLARRIPGTALFQFLAQNLELPENCNGGGRSLQHKPNKYNGSLIPFSGGIAFHCTWKTPDRSDFAKIEHRASDMAGQAVDHHVFRGLPGGRERLLEGNLRFEWKSWICLACRPIQAKLLGVSPEYLAGSLKQARWATESSWA